MTMPQSKGLLCKGWRQLLFQHQLLRVQRQIPEVFCIAQRLRITCGRSRVEIRS
jgi:hypothetical protein